MGIYGYDLPERSVHLGHIYGFTVPYAVRRGSVDLDESTVGGTGNRRHRR